MQVQHRYVLFADIKGFSKIPDAELPDVMSEVWTNIGSILEPYRDGIVTYNTWGDALFLVFQRAGVVAAILQIRDWFRSHPSLAVRIACHFGDFFEYEDEFLGRTNAVGANVNLAARIEPVTRPNSIFVTAAFRQALTTAREPGKPSDVDFDPLGEIELAKKFGQQELYLLRRSGERRHILDRLAEMDLSRALPDFPALTTEQSQELDRLSLLSSAQLQALHAFQPDAGGKNASFGVRLAELHKARGNYEIAASIVEALLSVTLDADGLLVRPLEQETEFGKLRANIATRRGNYDLAHNLLYGLYKSGSKDTDTLTMLASCYKRRAFFDTAGQPHPSPLQSLLERSRDLYLEAVRKDISDYYPVINAAYAYAFLRQEGLAGKLAAYCRELLEEAYHQDWWSASTYAETEVIQSDYDEASRLLHLAIETHHPRPFHQDALVDQLKLLFAVRKAAELDELITELEGVRGRSSDRASGP